MKTSVLPTVQEMIPARDAVEVHAYDFMVNNELLLRILERMCIEHSLITHYLKCWMFSVFV